jgi:uncharacterized protein YeaO (DUF488 family)
MFTHASVYDKGANESPGLKVLVMRQWPRGVRKDRVDVWLKEAGPSRQLLDAYNHAGLSWSEFESRYRAEILQERPEVLDNLRELAREHGTVTLMCFERMPPHEHCHRLTLMDMLQRDQAQVSSTVTVSPPTAQ